MSARSIDRIFDRASFGLAIVAGTVAAISGGAGWTITSIAAGILAAVAPIVGRIATNRIKRAEDDRSTALVESANARASAAAVELGNLKASMLPRKLLEQQRAIIVSTLEPLPSFNITVSHNRHEAEPAAYHAQIVEALKAGGLDVTWFGGMTNSTVGIEISGPDGGDKSAVMSAFSTAGVPFLPIQFTDDLEHKRGIEIWIGVHPGLHA